MGKKRAEPEQRLCPNIARIFEDRGYEVIYKGKGYEFVIHPYEKKERLIDLVAYKQYKDLKNIETIAVEVKNKGSVWGDINDALAQATDCLPYFDKVYIGAEEGDVPPDKKRLLELLNIGLITAREKRGEKGKIELDSTKAGIFGSKRKCIVKSKIIVPIIFEEVFDEMKKSRKKKFGKLGELLSGAKYKVPPDSKNPHHWIAIELESGIQFQASCDYEHKDIKEAAACICINLETTPTIREIFKGLNKKNMDRFFQILKKIQNCYLDLVQYPFKKGRKVIPEYRDIYKELELGKNLTRKKFGKISRILKRGYSDRTIPRGKGHHLHLQFWIEMWRTHEKLTKNEYKKRMLGVVNRLKNLYIFLEERYSE